MIAPTQTPQAIDPGPDKPPGVSHLRLIITLGLCAVIAALLWNQITNVNGPYYWRWPWIQLNNPLTSAAWVILAALPALLGHYFFACRRFRPTIAILLAMVSTVAMEIVAQKAQNLPDQTTGQRIAWLVESPSISSYYYDAVRLQPWLSTHTIPQFLSKFPAFLPKFNIHARFRPPGPILYCLAWIAAMGVGDSSALAAGLAIALLAALSVPATYFLLKHFLNDRPSALCGATLLALSPALVLVYPEFDQFYPVISCALYILWSAFLRRRSYLCAAAYGLLLAAGFFCSYIFIFTGVLPLLQAIYHIIKNGRAGIVRVLFGTLLAAVIFVAFYVLLYLATGFDPVATFRVSFKDHIGVNEYITPRPYPMSIPFDLWDLSMGVAWIGVILALMDLIRRKNARRPATEQDFMVLFAVLQFLAVPLLGLMPGESIRLFMISLPLILIPAGSELARWSGRQRITIFAVEIAMTISILLNMVFLS